MQPAGENRSQSPSRDGARPVPAPSARQGVTGHNVRYVLGFSLAAVIVAFIIIYLLFFGSHLGA
jgi:hypothetical protein